ncbi:MAG: hypothetical protein OXN89_11045 [Bryobacterales bacterium]|nr:hypothetical protein [Bryobacterales bacterium]
MATAEQAGGLSKLWARLSVCRCEAGWGIGEFLRALKGGLRIDDRRLRTAKPPKESLAFDVITTWRTYSLARYAPHTLTEYGLKSDEKRVTWGQMQCKWPLPPEERVRKSGDTWTWVALVARIVGSRPANRRSLPGDDGLSRSCVDWWQAVEATKALRETGVES